MAARRWLGRRAGMAMLTSVGVLAACRQLVGIGDAPPAAPDAGAAGDGAADAGPAACGVAYTNASCEQCLEGSCCDEAKTCAGSAACATLEGCLGACGGDPACRARCTLAHLIAPDPAEDRFAACLATHCAQPCALACGGIAQLFGPDAAGACQSCVVDTMCPVATECETDPECRALGWCALLNPAQDRNEVCQDEHDAGLDAFSATLAALQSSCIGPCAYGNQWHCLGNSQPPLSIVKTTAMSLRLFDFRSNDIVTDASVVACPTLDPTCNPPVAQGTLGDAGRFGIDIPGSVLGSGATGYVEVSGGDRYPELFFWGYPLSEPYVLITIPTLSQAFASLLGPALGVTVDMSRGMVAAIVSDCDVAFSPGVAVSVSPSDPDTQVLYKVGTTFGATDAGTDPQGVALVVNVPPGPIHVTATPAALGRPSSVVTALARGNALTVLELPPNQ